MTFSLINFNTLGTPVFAPDITSRYKKTAEIINAENVDIVCLQEIQTYYHLYLFKKYLKNFPYIVYEKFLYGPKGGLVIFSKLPVVSPHFREFTALGEFNNITFYSQLLRNGILTCQLKDKPVTIATTHLTCDYFFDWAPENKLYKTVAQQITDITHEIMPVLEKEKSIILTGDFNSKKGGRLYTSFLKETHLIDAFSDMETPTYDPTRIRYTFMANRSARIDHLFYAKGKAHLTLHKHEQIFEKRELIGKNKSSHLSDHIGLKVNFDIV